MDKDVSTVKFERQYRPDIDGLRALAVMAVVFFHAFPDITNGGFVGVDIFFVISGYLISGIIFGQLANHSFSFLDFYGKRIRRIFPALVAVLLSCLALGWYVLLSDEYLELGTHTVAATSFISNLILLRESGYFDSAADTKILLHLWSLGIEEQFYLVWPILLWAAYKLRINWLLLILVIGYSSFFLNIHGINSEPVSTFYSPQTRFWELLIGAMLAYLFIPGNACLLGLNNYVKHLLSTLGVCFIACSFLFVNKTYPQPGYWGLLPTLGTALLIAAGPAGYFNSSVLSRRPMVWIGLISFPLYLWHWPMLAFSRILESQTPIVSIRLAAVFISIVLAWSTYYFIERPLRFGSHIRIKLIGLVTLLLFISALGFLIWTGGGLEFRDPSKSNVFMSQKIEQSFQESCSLNFKNIPKTHCAQIDSGQDIVLIVGDSHVRHWFEVLKEKIKQNGFDVVALSKGGCPFLLNTGVPNVPECIETNAEVLRFIESNSSRIKAILFAGQYETYTPLGYLRDSQGNNLIFSEALQSTLTRLGDHKIIFLDQIPPLSFDPKKCIKRPYRISTNDSECQTLKSLVVAELSFYKSERDLAISLHKNVSIFNADDALCDNDFCSAMNRNLLLYYDKTHLNPNGVKYVRDRVDKMHLPLD